MLARELGVAAGTGVPLRLLDGFLGFDGQLIETHEVSFREVLAPKRERSERGSALRDTETTT
jgi:hypothetical protein